MRKIQLWRPAGQFAGIKHGLNTGPDLHVETTERTLIFEGPIVDHDGVPWVGPLEWNRDNGMVPSRFGPPNWTMTLADLRAWVQAHQLVELWGDELVELDD